MNNKGRQLTIGAIGLVTALSGVMFRLVVLDPRTHDSIALIASFGRIRKASGPLWNAYDGASVHNMLASIALALFYAGLVLIVASVIAWLVGSQKGEEDDRAAS
ncbi:MAG TPA: hypothetical protein VK846_03930 [Candidatus Limnocylindria bacterium]|nr:hypothetical protein [Candidatus Limnocylindria bacterium]